jgi:hypothetical protein
MTDHRKRLGAVLGVLLFSLGCVASQKATPETKPAAASAPAGFEWPIPAGWREEIIPFPLEFAPDITYRGREEIRFAPGFFDPDAKGYWSYAFVWWLEEPAPLDERALADALLRYYRGLSLAVGGAKYTFDPGAFRADVRPDPAATGGPGKAYVGELATYDAFTTGKPLALRLRAYVFECAAARHQVALVAVSPKAEADPIWRELAELLGRFRCS